MNMEIYEKANHLDYLITLPATDVMEATKFPQTLAHERHHEKQVAACRERDELQSQRSADCWCLGLGGRNVSWIDSQNGIYECHEYCSCEDAARVKTAAETELDRIQEARRAKAFKRLVDQCGIPSRLKGVTFDTYPLSKATKVGFDAIRFWAEGCEEPSWRDLRKSIYIWGPTGSGKTGLATAALKACMYEGDPGQFWTVGGMLGAIQRTFDQKEPVKKTRAQMALEQVEGRSSREEEIGVLEYAQEVEYLVLDDIGTQNPTNWRNETLFELINDRHGADRTTIFTSNYSLDELEKRIGDRLAWRIREMAEVVHLTGPNLRDRDQLVEGRAVDEAKKVLKMVKP